MMSVLIPPGIDPCTVALVPAPDGSPPNFYGRNAEDPGTISIAVFLIALVSIVLAVRLYMSWGKFRLPDYFTLIAYVLVVSFLSIFLSLHKFHRSIWNIPACWLDASYLKRYFLQILLLGPALFFAKAAIQLLYLEVFGHNVRARRWLYASIIFSAFLYATFIPISLYYNAPHVGQSWRTLEEDIGHIDSAILFKVWSISIGALSTVLDLFIFAFPVVLLRNLHVTRAKKIQILCLFGVGILGVSTSLSSLVYRVQLFQGARDVTLLQAALGISNMFEASYAIIIGCTPACAGFCREYIATLPIWGSILRSLGISKHVVAKDTNRSSNMMMGNNSWPQPSRTTQGARPISQHTDEYELLHQIRAVRSAGPSSASQQASGDGANMEGLGGITKTIDIVQYSSSRPTSSAGKSV